MIVRSFISFVASLEKHAVVITKINRLNRFLLIFHVFLFFSPINLWSSFSINSLKPEIFHVSICKTFTTAPKTVSDTNMNSLFSKNIFRACHKRYCKTIIVFLIQKFSHSNSIIYSTIPFS